MDALLVCSPYCLASLGTIARPDAPFELPARCYHCGSDPRNDAPLELRRSAWEALDRSACGACAALVPDLATRCASCGEKLPERRAVEVPLALPGETVEARSGARLVVRGGTEYAIVELGAVPARVERTVDAGRICGAALSASGTLALASDVVRVLAAGSPELRSLGAPPGIQPRAVGFLGETLMAFPSTTTDEDADLRPWIWSGEAWSPVVALPEGKGWEDTLGIWWLEGAVVPSSGGPTHVLWDGRAYRCDGASFLDLGVEGLRLAPRLTAVALGERLLVVSNRALVEIQRGRPLRRPIPELDDLLFVHRAPGDALILGRARNGAGDAGLILWPDGTRTRLTHAWLRTRDGGWFIATDGALWVGAEGRVRVVPWSTVAALPRSAP